MTLKNSFGMKTNKITSMIKRFLELINAIATEIVNTVLHGVYGYHWNDYGNNHKEIRIHN